VGEPFTWRVVVSNTASVATAESVDVSDVLPANWTYVPGSASFTPGGAAEPTIAGSQLTWDNVGDIAPGGQIVLTFQARPTVDAITDPGTGPGSPNVNDVSATAVDASGASGSADGPYADEDDAQAVLELPELTIDKTPDGATVNAGAPATYTIEVGNDGDVPARDVVVTDVLGPGQTYTSGTATATPSTGFSETSVTPGPGAGETTIEWAIAQIPANSSVTITLPVDTDPSLADDSQLVNDVSAVSREVTTPVSNEGSLMTDVDSDVAILKTPQAAPVDAGEEMDWTLLVTNNGPSDATGVTVEDVLPADLTFVSASAPCVNSSGTVTCAIGDLAAGDSVSLTLRTRIDPNETVEVENTASVTSTTPDSNPNNNESTADKPIGVEANVRVEKDGPDAPVLQGTSFDYVIHVENAGASSATDVTLNDPLPAGVEYESVTTDVGSCSESGGTIDCSFGTMQPDDEAQVTVRVRAVDVGTWDNVAAVSTPSTESTTADNEDDAEVEVVPAADLGTTKSAPATADPGSEIDYTLGVRNNGPSPATGVTLSDTLPAGVQFVSADPACSDAGGVVTCEVGDLAVDESRSYTVRVAIPYALGGQTLTNSVVVHGNEGDLVTENDTAQATTTVGPAADLAIAKTAGGATAGGTASWTIVVENHGPSTGDPVTVSDSLPAGTTFRSATPSQGSCSAAGDGVSCNLGALASGASAQISVVADVAPGTAGQELRNQATVSAPQADPDPSNNKSEAVTKIGEPAPGGPNLALTKTASTERPQLGKPFSYRIAVRNVGDRPARRVRVVDTLSDAVRLRSVAASKGRCESEGAKATCSLGTLAPGAQATVKLVVIPTRPGLLRNTASATTDGSDVQPRNNRGVAGVRVTAPRASWKISKRAARRAVRGGETVRFAITVRAGNRAVANARVCDPLPGGLVFARARGARFQDGSACWTLRYLGPGAKRTWHIMARAERGFRIKRVRNVAVATARNAPRRADGARVRIDPAFGGAGGGVTG
jgi:large repetitive protein